jgi:hypothetical protein
VIHICEVAPSGDLTTPGACTGGEASICPATDAYLEVVLSIDGVVQDVSHWCRPPTDPPPVGIAQVVPSEEDEQHLVAFTPDLSTAPATRTVTQLPTWFWTTRPAPRRRVLGVAGYPGLSLTLDLTPVAWTWDFGDGTPTRTTTDPGAPYPDGTVRHAYRQAGAVGVSVQTGWQARSTLTTPLGALPSRIEPGVVLGPLGRARLGVRQARAVLIGGSD